MYLKQSSSHPSVPDGRPTVTRRSPDGQPKIKRHSADSKSAVKLYHNVTIKCSIYVLQHSFSFFFIKYLRVSKKSSIFAG